MQSIIRLIVFIGITTLPQLVTAQVLPEEGEIHIKRNPSRDVPKAPPGKVKYYFADNRIQKLDSLTRENPPKLEGYRVQLFFGEKKVAQELREKFENEYPGVATYISYLAPNFRLRVGDFRSRMESEKFKIEIQTAYPGCYIVKDRIELPPLPDPNANMEVIFPVEGNE